jgi:hypothetical protein
VPAKQEIELHTPSRLAKSGGKIPAFPMETIGAILNLVRQNKVLVIHQPRESDYCIALGMKAERLKQVTQVLSDASIPTESIGDKRKYLHPGIRSI